MTHNELRAMPDRDLLQNLLTNPSDASKIRLVLHERMMRANVANLYDWAKLSNGPQTTAQPAPSQPQQMQLPFDDVRQTLEECLEGKTTLRKAAEVLLDSGWDYTDPGVLMEKPPQEIEQFLRDLTGTIGKYTDLQDSPYKRLIRMIFDAYCREFVRRRTN